MNPETDISHDELKKALEAKQKEEDGIWKFLLTENNYSDQKIAEGKITFKKPVKRAAEDGKEVYIDCFLPQFLF